MLRGKTTFSGPPPPLIKVRMAMGGANKMGVIDLFGEWGMTYEVRDLGKSLNAIFFNIFFIYLNFVLI